ncbi:MAG: hypothetical protein ACFFE5_16175, partial [Candidatus Thorarchaeota archaeon]
MGNQVMTLDNEKIWYKTARAIVKAGQMPMPVNETLIELLKLIMKEEQAEFLQIFRKPSLNINQIKERTSLGEEELNRLRQIAQGRGVNLADLPEFAPVAERVAQEGVAAQRTSQQ